MEPKPQTDGSGGKIGGPPPVARGFFGEDDGNDRPRKNAGVRREQRAGPATLKDRLCALRRYFKGVMAEYSRLQWPETREFLQTTLFMISFAVALFTLGFI